MRLPRLRKVPFFSAPTPQDRGLLSPGAPHLLRPQGRGEPEAMGAGEGVSAGARSSSSSHGC